MKKLLTILLLYVFSFGSWAQVSLKKENERSDNNVVAHRGAWKKEGLPQNSIASLRRAIDLKCAASEFDVRITLDDSLVIVHDPHYKGMEIEKTTYRNLIASKLPNGEIIPTLREYLLEGLRENEQTKMVCEIKPSPSGTIKGEEIATKVIDLVNSLDAGDKVIYISFDYHILKKIIQLDKTAVTQYLEGNRDPLTVSKDGINAMNYHYSVYQKYPHWIDLGKEKGLKLNTWTVNDPEVMDWFIKHDFDYISTDEPEILLEKYLVKNQLINNDGID